MTPEDKSKLNYEIWHSIPGLVKCSAGPQYIIGKTIDYLILQGWKPPQ